MYERLYRGYTGEKKLAAFLKNELVQPHIPIYDLRLKIGNSECQMDSLLIFEQAIYLLEVKNFQGDFYIENNRWFMATQKEIKNPLHQLKRNELLLQDFLTKQQIVLPIRPFVVFVHPGFQLYQAPFHSPIIFPSQLKRFASKLRGLPNQLHDHHQQIANQLTTNHIKTSSHEQIPEYEYQTLQKGILCKNCKRYMIPFNTSSVVCKQCTQKEPLESAVVRSVMAFALLFPDTRITTNRILDWCGGIASRRTMQRILGKHFHLVTHGKWSHYTI